MMDACWAIAWSALWKGSLVLAFAGVVAILLRRSSAALRHAMWLAAVSVVALLAIAAVLPTGNRSPGVVSNALVFRMASGPQITPDAGSRTVPFGAALWLAVSSILLLRVGLAHLAVYRAARAARRIGTLSGPVAVVEGASASMPVCWGFRKPVIFLPPEASRWDAAVRESVLKHELAHIARRDCLWQLFGRVVASLLWFQPLLWWAVWRIAEESEHAADDAVLRQGAEADNYAGHLISVARCLRATPMAALAVVRPSRLESRVKALLSEGACRGRLGRASLLALVFIACGALLPMAMARHSGEKAYSISDGVSMPSVIHKVEPKMTPEARDAKVEGAVMLSIEVDKQGIARNIKTVRWMPYGLTESAIEAVSQWRFKPGRKDGKPVRVKAWVEVNFRLN